MVTKALLPTSRDAPNTPPPRGQKESHSLARACGLELLHKPLQQRGLHRHDPMLMLMIMVVVVMTMVPMLLLLHQLAALLGCACKQLRCRKRHL